VILQHKQNPSHIGEHTMARLAAFDMDGTLLMPDHRLGEKRFRR
jgi:HMP-PP phosphatase